MGLPSVFCTLEKHGSVFFQSAKNAAWAVEPGNEAIYKNSLPTLRSRPGSTTTVIMHVPNQLLKSVRLYTSSLYILTGLALPESQLIAEGGVTPSIVLSNNNACECGAASTCRLFACSS